MQFRCISGAIPGRAVHIRITVKLKLIIIVMAIAMLIAQVFYLESVPVQFRCRSGAIPGQCCYSNQIKIMIAKITAMVVHFDFELELS